MGLDMYLNKKIYIGNKWRKEKPATLVKVIVPENQEGVTFPTKAIKNERVSEIVEEVAYWRKANAIHKWFVDHCGNDDGNDTDIYVPHEKLQELVDTCKKVLAASKLVDGKIKNGERMANGKWEPIMEDGKYIEDPTVAKELLPTESGFFFGSTDYDEYYIQDLEDTVKMLEPVLAEDNEDYQYEASY